MALTIQVRSEDADVPPVTFDAPRVILGRGQSSDLRLPDPSVSRRHASVRQRGADYIVLDEGSVNGTYVGSTKLAPGAPHVVQSGDIVRCGLVALELTIESTAATPNPQQLTREIALLLVEGALVTEGRPTTPFVVVQGGPDDGLEFSLDEPDKLYAVGRGPQADFDLQDEDVSRRHVGLERRGSDVMIRDLGAKNRVKIGDDTLPLNGERRWTSKFPLQLSQATTLCLRDPLSETLIEIEAAPDEVLDEAAQRAALPEPAQAKSGRNPEVETRRILTRVEQPGRSRRFTPSDIVIGLLALAILGASMTGMYWLARG
jgi:pSer/pThr/pTyr-binding forkhead associated (FHA) protein